MPGPFEKTSLPKRLGNFTKVLFLSKFPMNLLALAVIISLSIFSYHSLVPAPQVTGNVIADIVPCPGSEQCLTSCDQCPVKKELERIEVTKYQCADGTLQEDLEDCKVEYPKVQEKFSGAVGDITFSIDDVSYILEEDGLGTLLRVDYTIINKGSSPLVPRLEMKVYEEWSTKAMKALPNKVVDLETVIGPESFLQRSENVRITFKGAQPKVRILLVNALADPDEEIIAVSRDILKQQE
ncbi:hypothetical protein HYU13_00195 [Candidatus Woesearchaeota archaeon]|nr:hypothetical protein [Candidatus Woesearchaeota archaeon]